MPRLREPLQRKDAIIRFILESQRDYVLAQSREQKLSPQAGISEKKVTDIH